MLLSDNYYLYLAIIAVASLKVDTVDIVNG